MLKRFFSEKIQQIKWRFAGIHSHYYFREKMEKMRRIWRYWLHLCAYMHCIPSFFVFIWIDTGKPCWRAFSQDKRTSTKTKCLVEAYFFRHLFTAVWMNDHTSRTINFAKSTIQIKRSAKSPFHKILIEKTHLQAIRVNYCALNKRRHNFL